MAHVPCRSEQAGLPGFHHLAVLVSPKWSVDMTLVVDAKQIRVTSKKKCY